jgi:hypothetical protein
MTGALVLGCRKLASGTTRDRRSRPEEHTARCIIVDLADCLKARCQRGMVGSCDDVGSRATKKRLEVLHQPPTLRGCSGSLAIVTQPDLFK